VNVAENVSEIDFRIRRLRRWIHVWRRTRDVM